MALDHAGVPGTSGGYVGVDVFFVISGFLITGWLLGRALDSARVPFGDFYAARARRILPAAALALVVICAASVLYLNVVRAISTLHDALWAAVFAANIHFADVGTDYFARGDPPSPIQHFWTLSVEEQFYLGWPLLLAAALVVVSLGRRRGVSRGALAGVVALGVAASLAWSIHLTASNPTAAYFSTAARAWELGTGALIAIGLPWIVRVPGALRAALTWVGLAGIIVATVAYGPSTPFPGSAALLPVVAAGLVVAGGAAPRPSAGAALILGRQPLPLVGDLSYAFYLWHWPPLAIAAQYAGHPLSMLQNLLLLAGAFALSYATYRVYENPLRHARRLKPPRLALALWPASVTAVVLAVSLGVSSLTSPSAAAPSLEISPGAARRGRTGPPQDGPRGGDRERRAGTPAPARPARPRPAARAAAPRHLPHGELRSGHGQHHVERLQARRHDGSPAPGRARRLTRDDVDARLPAVCRPLPLDARAARQARVCAVRDGLRQVRGLVQLGTRAGKASPPTCDRGVASLVRLGAGGRRSSRPRAPGPCTPHPSPHRRRGSSRTETGRARLSARSRRHARFLRVAHHPGRGGGLFRRAARRAARPERATSPRMQWFCARDLCPAVVGTIVTYRDTSHVTATYVRVLADPLGSLLAAATRG